jgi:hypothetical protein
MTKPGLGKSHEIKTGYLLVKDRDKMVYEIYIVRNTENTGNFWTNVWKLRLRF